MADTNWLKQGAEPLFPDLLWSRPENKRHAGKLLIVGGNIHGFAASVAAYNAAEAAGVGTARVILPDALKKALGNSFKQAEFAPSTPSGSLARKALDSLLENASWADAVLLAGDFGRNSETAILLSSFLDKFTGKVTAAQDTLDYFLEANSPLLTRQNPCFAINLGQLQKLAKNNRATAPIKHSMNLHDLINFLQQWLTSGKYFITQHQSSFLAAAEGRVSTTPSAISQGWEVPLAAYASVWLIQHPQKPFEALTTAIFDYRK